VYYYLRIVMTMYFKEPTREAGGIDSRPMAVAITLCVLFVLFMGLLPESWLGLATSSVMLGRP
jgi:NADH:ubiquinone oxidoreductase subunit 2 (subunit N)